MFLNILLLQAAVAELLFSPLVVTVNKQTADVVPKAPPFLLPVAPSVAMAAGPLAAVTVAENQYFFIASAASLFSLDSEDFDHLTSAFYPDFVHLLDEEIKSTSQVGFQQRVRDE